MFDKKLEVKALQENPFHLIGTEWMLVTAQDASGKVNTMTASWGGVGVLWNKNVAFVFIRPQRYTREFIEQADSFSLCFLDESYRKQLSYLGTVSGRDEDKIAKAGLHTAHIGDVPVFEEARLVLTIKKLYKQSFAPECFIDKSLDTQNYAQKDYHIMYIGEITGAYANS